MHIARTRRPIEAFTTRWFGEVFRDTLLQESLANSLFIACIVTVICVSGDAAFTAA